MRKAFQSSLNNNNLMFAYDIQNISNSAGGWGVLPRENLAKYMYVLFGDILHDVRRPVVYFFTF